MKIFYPIPPQCLDKPRLLTELERIMQVHDNISAGNFSDPETSRWATHLPALYDRYQKSRDYLNEHYQSNYPDHWIHEPLRQGAECLYPEIPQDEVLDMWGELLMSDLVLEYSRKT